MGTIDDERVKGESFFQKRKKIKIRLQKKETFPPCPLLFMKYPPESTGTSPKIQEGIYFLTSYFPVNKKHHRVFRQTSWCFFRNIVMFRSKHNDVFFNRYRRVQFKC